MSDDPIVTIDELLLSGNDEEVIIMGGADGEPACTFPRCHCDHEVVELYTKRHFRCDCGNSNFKGASECKLWEEKDDVNVENKYDQTFDGVFCVCSRPYPDPDAEEEFEMFQCGICEDWFHTHHLGLPPDFLPNDDYEELTCLNCIKRLPLLWLLYYSLMHSQEKESCVELDEEPSSKKPRRDSDICPPEYPSSNSNGEICRMPQVLANCGVDTATPSPATLQKLVVRGFSFPSPIFWPKNWRTSALCACESCRNMLKTLDIEFILDPEDSIAHYMQVGKQRVQEIQSERESAISAALSELPHSAAINIARGTFVNTPLDVVTSPFVAELTAIRT
ncbi:unnamed protein product [Mesocestoides corti]|uniref:UBR-type domain-containing protein n=1 Tax=Mesocestoides corti TaxID=53468 RepID=A0A0R3URF2_MESCO|nr:unnamed protein product [Mesocestoides corti]